LIQKLRSPFFDSIPPRNSPPYFESTEIKLNQVLGAGEYCRIHEVVHFEVPESCHICFLHRGYEDSRSSPSENSTLSSATPKRAAAAAENVVFNVVKSKTKDETQSPSKSKKSTITIPLTSPETDAGHKRGVSWGDIPKVITKLSSAENLSLAERNTMDLPKKSNDREISFFAFESDFQPDDNISDYDDFEEDHQDEFDHETRGFMKDHCLRAGEARYAVKRIKHELEGEDIIDAAIDLAREAQFLAGLSHPSIIKIRGTVGVAGHPKFSIVLDRLYETLDAKMLIWNEEVKKYQGPLPLLGFKKNKKALKKNWISRLLFAYDIAHAMDYLHSHG
jgi:serine/threonine protein kinase